MRENGAPADALVGSAFHIAEMELGTSDIPAPAPAPITADSATLGERPKTGAITAAGDGANDVQETGMEQDTPEVRASGADPSPQPPGEPEKPAMTAGYLSVTVEPDAEILVDGIHRLHGGDLRQLELPSGEHDVICRKEGYREYRETIRIKRDELSRRNIILRQITGSINIITDPGVQIYIDGLYKGRTPLKEPITVPTGEHRIELRKIGYQNWSNEAYVPADEALQLRIALVPL